MGLALCVLRSAEPGSKVIVVSENAGVAELGTTAAMRVKPLPREEFCAKVLSSLLRTNLTAQFLSAVLGVVRRFDAELRGDEDHFSKFGVAKIALEILPVPLRLKSEELLRSATAAPREEVRIVLWESACPPNYRYTVVCEKVETHGPHANIERKRHARQP
ncbi:unnamed protein product [Miscanthus lutarioriparius]|uniref:Uncharacterized protein n=1 Tax=Miscanthus lutarioriparius TaxID=422564 RepID=A0A811QIF7_9POAL|nr:unnamed protein product [Miscanthus lutarioriparius]